MVELNVPNNNPEDQKGPKKIKSEIAETFFFDPKANKKLITDPRELFTTRKVIPTNEVDPSKNKVDLLEHYNELVRYINEYLQKMKLTEQEKIELQILSRNLSSNTTAGSGHVNEKNFMKIQQQINQKLGGGEIRSSEQVCQDLLRTNHTTLDQIVLTPDVLEALGEALGSTERNKGVGYDRMSELLALCVYNGVSLGSIKAYSGKLTNDNGNTIRRDSSYTMLHIPTKHGPKTIFVCNSYGNASFIVDGEMDPYTISTWTKQSIQALKNAKKIIFTSDDIIGWTEKIRSALFDKTSTEKTVTDSTPEDLSPTEPTISPDNIEQKIQKANFYLSLLETSIKIDDKAQTLKEAVLGGTEQYEKRAKAYNTGQEKETQIAKSLPGFLSAFCVEGEIKVGEKEGKIDIFLTNGTIAQLIINAYITKNKNNDARERKLIDNNELVKLIKQSYVYDAEQYIKLLNKPIEGKTLKEAVVGRSRQYAKRAKAYNTGQEKETQIPSELPGFLSAFCVGGEKIQVGEKEGKYKVDNFLRNGTIAQLIIKKYLAKNEDIPQLELKQLISNDELVKLIKQSYVYDAEQYSSLLNTKIDGQKQTLMQAVLGGTGQYHKRAEAYNQKQEKDKQIPPKLSTFLGAFCVKGEIKVGEKEGEIYAFLTNGTIAQLIINAYQTKNEGKDMRERKLIDNDKLVKLIKQSYVYDAEQYSSLLDTQIDDQTQTLKEAVLGGTGQYHKRAEAYNQGKPKDTQIPSELPGFLSAFCVGGKIKVGDKEGYAKDFLQNGTIAQLVIDAYQTKNEGITELEQKQLIDNKELVQLIQQPKQIQKEEKE